MSKFSPEEIRRATIAYFLATVEPMGVDVSAAVPGWDGTYTTMFAHNPEATMRLFETTEAAVEAVYTHPDFPEFTEDLLNHAHAASARTSTNMTDATAEDVVAERLKPECSKHYRILDAALQKAVEATGVL